MIRELKNALNDLDDCEIKLKGNDKDRALYELSFGYDRVKKVLKALQSS